MEGVDFFETYSLISKITCIRALNSLASIHNFHIYEVDIKTVVMKEQIYMKQLGGFIMPELEKKVCKLVKSLYGL